MKLSEPDMRAYIRRQVRVKYRTIKALAAVRGVHANYLSWVIHHGKLPRWMLKEFGVSRETVYRVTGVQ